MKAIKTKPLKVITNHDKQTKLTRIRKRQNGANKKKRRGGIEKDESRKRKKRKLNKNNMKTIQDRFHKLFDDKMLLMKESRCHQREKDLFEKEKSFYKQKMELFQKERNFYKDKYEKLKKQIISFGEDQNMNTSQNKNKYNDNKVDMDLNMNGNENDINLNIDDENIINKNEMEMEHKISDNNNECVLLLPSLKYKEFADIQNASNELNESNSNNMSNNDEEYKLKYDQLLQYNFDSDFIEKLLSIFNGQYSILDIFINKIIYFENNDKSNTSNTNNGQIITHQKRKQLNISSSNGNGKKSKSKSSNKKNKIYDSSEETDDVFDDNHFISVECKYCGQPFDEYPKYIEHLKNEFGRDGSKKWLYCNECDKTKRYNNTSMFIGHLCGIHDHQYPFHCNIINELNGKRCNFSASTKGNLKQHLKGKQHQQKREKSNDILEEVETESDDVSIPDLEELEENDNDSNNDSDDSEYIEYDDNISISNDDGSEYDEYRYYDWNDCHFISVHCKFCGKHWDEYDQYVKHLQNHFDRDPLKKWRQCNECGYDEKKIYVHSAAFLSHLHHRHNHENPFHCKQKTLNGDKCHFSATTKCNMVSHLKKGKHKIKVLGLNKYKKKWRH